MKSLLAATAAAAAVLVSVSPAAPVQAGDARPIRSIGFLHVADAPEIFTAAPELAHRRAPGTRLPEGASP